jgi:hypothetical protein
MKGKITAIAEATTKSGKPYVKVSLEERKYPTVIFDDLKAKWPILIVGEEVELKMVKDGVDKDGKDRWKCVDIIPVSFSLEKELDTVQTTTAPPKATPSPVQQATAQPLAPFNFKEMPKSYIQESSQVQKEEIIVREVAVKAAAELYQGSKDTLAMLSSAQLIQKWIKGDIKDIAEK